MLFHRPEPSRAPAQHLVAVAWGLRSPPAPAPAARGTGGSHTSCRWPQLFPSELLIPSTRRHWHFSPVRRQAAHTDAVTGSGRRRQRRPRPLVPGSYPRRSVPCPEHAAGLEQRWGGFGDSNLNGPLFLLLPALGASREVLCGTLQRCLLSPQTLAQRQVGHISGEQSYSLGCEVRQSSLFPFEPKLDPRCRSLSQPRPTGTPPIHQTSHSDVGTRHGRLGKAVLPPLH